MAVTIELEASDLAAIAAAIRLDQAAELARIDQSISSRLASVDYAAPDNTDTLAAIAALNDITPAEAAAAVWNYTE